MMMLPLLILAASNAAQANPSPGPPPAASQRTGRPFISPMGEPFRPARGGSGLTDWFNQADRDHDGKLTLDEVQADADRFFALLDINHDGEIDPDEITRYETDIAPEIAGSQGQGAGRLNLLGMPEPVTAADSNFNRGVSREEFRQAATQRFVALDLNHQGYLSLSVLQSIRPAQRRERDPDIDPSTLGPPDEGDATSYQPQ
jgi:Ca2+-binding EF-hand superfamily protein